MSIASEIQTLSNNKIAIKSAIEGLNPTIPPTQDMSQWPTSLGSVETGGGGGLQGYNLTKRGGDGITITLADGTETQLGYGSSPAVSNVIAVTPGYGTNTIVNSNGSVSVFYGSDSPNVKFLLTEDTTFEFNEICLLKGTKIALADGSEKDIEDITYDDELLSWDFDEGRLTKAKPVWIKRVQTNTSYFLDRFKSGKILKSTGRLGSGFGHRVFNIDREKFVYDVESVGCRVFTLNGIDTQMSCELIEEPCEYYNIITDRHINMFANGILTSCSLNNIYPFDVKTMKFVKDGNRELRKIEDYDGIPQDLFDGFRLAENDRDIGELNTYVNRLVKCRIER